MRFTIEARELTSEYTHRPSIDRHLRRTIVEADTPSDAINQYVHEKDAELVSFTRPGRSEESIATVKKEDTVFLVRVYAA